MALELSYSVCITSCCKEISITDSTGDYDASTNTTGWGTPNLERGDVTDASLVITDADGYDYTIDVTTEVQDGTDITVTSDLIGLAAGVDITSGVYYFTLTVTDGVDTYYFDVTKLFYCTEEKAFQALVGTFNPDSCTCCSGHSTMDDILDIWVYMLALKNAACCGKVDKFTELLEIINQLLGHNPCSNC